MIDKEIETALHFNSLYLINGDSYKSLDWGSVESQRLRFKILTEIENINDKKILDVGCGLGHYYSYLLETGMNIDYTGIDIASDMIERAKSIYPDVKFFKKSILDFTVKNKSKYDYIIASGIFSTYVDDGYEYMSKCIKHMWDISTNGIAFNSLSDWGKNKDSSEFYADPTEVLNLCKKYTCNVVLRHDYHPRDFTVYLYKE